MNAHNPPTSVVPEAAQQPQAAAIDLIDSDLWPHLLWARDRLRGRRRALLVGEGASLCAVLLAREGVEVEGFDPKFGQIEAIQTALSEDPPDVVERIRLQALEAFVPAQSAVGGTFDAVVVTGGPWGDLREGMAALFELLEQDGRAVVVLPFGASPPSKQLMCLPSVLAYELPGFSAEDISIVDARVRASLLRCPNRTGTPASPLESSALLRMTEAASLEQLASLRANLLGLKAKAAGLSKENRRLAAKVEEVYRSTSFQLGYALVSAIRSPRALLRLPLTLLSVLRNRTGGSVGEDASVPTPAPQLARGSGISEWQKEALRNRVRAAVDDGLPAIREVVENFLGDVEPAALANGYMVAAQICAQAGRHDLEFALGTQALETHRSVGILRGFLHVSLRARQMQAASGVLKELHALAGSGNRVASDFIRSFRETSSYKIAALELIPERPAHWRHPDGRRFAYVLHNSLPYSSGGYATRSQGLAKGLIDLGYRVTCVTRPGFPLDIKRELATEDIPQTYDSKGVAYMRVLTPSRIDQSEYEYIRLACDAMTEELRRLDPAYVQAGSNYVTGLPALVAARNLGLPFFYEVRGLWEITRLSRDETFGRSISFDVQRHIESTLAREADHVFTLTEPMREELIVRGVEPSRITLLPNSVDAERFHAKPRSQALAGQLGIAQEVPVIGYVGTFVVYEGLEDLTSACVELHRAERDFRLLLVGNENASGEERGPITEEILRIAEEGGIAHKLILPGRVPHDQVEDYYSLIDVCPFPRKPWPVCEMVSPMKPLEALAMKKAVVVSSVRALTEMIEHGRTGMVFEKGSIASLAETISTLLDDPGLRARLGEAGREWVATQRSWRQVAERIERVASEFDAQRAALAQASPVAGDVP